MSYKKIAPSFAARVRTKNFVKEGVEMDMKNFIQMLEQATEDEKNALCRALTPVLDRHAQDVFLNAVQAHSRQGVNKPCGTMCAWLALPAGLRHLFMDKQFRKCE